MLANDLITHGRCFVDNPQCGRCLLVEHQIGDVVYCIGPSNASPKNQAVHQCRVVGWSLEAREGQALRVQYMVVPTQSLVRQAVDGEGLFSKAQEAFSVLAKRAFPSRQ